MIRAAALLAVAVALGSVGGCTLSRGVVSTAEAGPHDANGEASIDAGVDAHVVLDDADVDAAIELDADFDAGGDDRDGGRDAASGDVGVDAMVLDDAGVDAGLDAGCAPVGGLACGGGDVLECQADGTITVRTDCAIDCVTGAGPPRCVHVVPTHVPTRDLISASSAALVVSSGQTVELDTDTGAITLMPSTVLRAAGAAGDPSGILFRPVTQVGAGELAIFVLGALTIENGGVLRSRGGRGLLLLASGAVDVRGTIDVGGNGRGAGAGGYAGGDNDGDGTGPSLGHGGGRDWFDRSGGGGAGHGGTGGAGGGEGGATGGASGFPSADPDSVVLLGGSGGGGGGGDDGGDGGGGGGILQITSDVSIVIASTGVIRAPGGGGGGGVAGGGGGAGGVIFLEAPTVRVDGAVSTNGGGGGGGSDGASGGRGTDTNDAATGGNGPGGGANGGAGSAGATLNGTAGEGGGGGGGGAGGRIRFVTRAGRTGSGVITPSGSVTTAMITTF